MIAGQSPYAAPEGDMMWKGVNARLHAAQLPGGWLSDMRNGRCTDGKPKPRKGLQLLSWTNQASSGAVVPLQIVGLQGVGVFADPDDQLWIIYAANGATYYCGPNNAARPIALPAGVSLSGQTIEFVQCMEKLIMFRGVDQPELQLRAVTEPWEVIPQMTNDPVFVDENPSDGTETIPNAPWGLAIQNRLLLPNAAVGTDVLSASDYFNYTRYQPTLSSFRINQGDAGAITGIFEVPTPDDTPASAVLVFKDDPSIHLVSGITGDLSGLARQTVTREYTAANRKAVWRVGRDVWFLAAGHGVCSLRQSDQNKWQGVDAPVSLDIQPLIDSIDWSQKASFRGVKVGNFSYIAVHARAARRNLLTGQTYNGSGQTALVPTENGLTYYWGGGTDASEVLARQTLAGVTTSPVAQGTFTADDYVYLINGPTSGACHDQIYQVSGNNCLLIYDHLNDAWAGYDTGLAVAEFLPLNYQGVERLFIFRAGGWFGLYEETSRDQIDSATWQDIDFSATTRGYALRSELGRVRVKAVQMQLKTWGPRYTIAATLDGANETQSIASQKTKSRTRYYRPFTAAPWVATNVNHDHGTKFREDYAPDLTSAVHVRDFNCDLYQETTEIYHCPKGTRGQYVTFTVSNDRGRAELHGVMLDSVKVDKQQRVKA